MFLHIDYTQKWSRGYELTLPSGTFHKGSKPLNTSFRSQGNGLLNTGLPGHLCMGS